jgi:hypothetical protein
MAITRKPKTIEKVAKEKDINALINKGGSAAENINVVEKTIGEKPIIIRVPSEALGKIDKIVKSKQIKTPRHTWLLEAIFEKLERES